MPNERLSHGAFSARRSATLVAIALLALTGGILLVGNDSEAGPAALKSDTGPAAKSDTRLSKSQIKRLIRREQRRGTQERAVSPSEDARKRCDRAGSETVFTTANARLMYLDWQGEEQGEDNGNRGAGCFYETGRTTELNFSNTIEGDSFGQVTGAGDFVGFVLSAWMADESGVDMFEMWNLRSGERVYTHSCSTERFDCRIHDIAVSEAGSLAYVACRNRSCLLIARGAGSTSRKTLARLHNPLTHMQAIHVNAGRLYWLQPNGRLRSARLP